MAVEPLVAGVPERCGAAADNFQYVLRSTSVVGELLRCVPGARYKGRLLPRDPIEYICEPQLVRSYVNPAEERHDGDKDLSDDCGNEIGHLLSPQGKPRLKRSAPGSGEYKCEAVFHQTSPV